MAEHWDHERYCRAVEKEVARFAAAVEGADPGLPVPTCPGWRMATLLEHIGGVHRWAEAIVRARATERVRRRDLDLGLPDDEAAYPAWLAAGAAPLVATFRAADPDAPVWAWGADQHERFWPRRMLHETSVHHADAELALGREPSIPADVAVDGVDEFLVNLPHAASFAPNVNELRGDGETLHWHCTDADGEWVVRLHRDGFTCERTHTRADVAVRAPAADLLLLAYGRRPLDGDRYEIYGDRALLDRWLAKSSI